MTAATRFIGPPGSAIAARTVARERVERQRPARPARRGSRSAGRVTLRHQHRRDHQRRPFARRRERGTRPGSARRRAQSRAPRAQEQDRFVARLEIPARRPSRSRSGRSAPPGTRNVTVSPGPPLRYERSRDRHDRIDAPAIVRTTPAHVRDAAVDDDLRARRRSRGTRREASTVARSAARATSRTMTMMQSTHRGSLL